jgi:sugar lactone lactonase YvrE
MVRRLLIQAGQIGGALQRPECVLVSPDGTLLVSDRRGGVTRIDAAGACTHLPCPGGASNGLALRRDGALILAGIDTGTIHILFPDGTAELLLDHFEGEPLGAVNFVHFDPNGDLWVTVSTRTVPRIRAVETPIPDGYLLKLTASGPRLMASGLCFANEIRFDACMEAVYLAETVKGRVLRMPIRPDGNLGPPRPFGPDPLFKGALVDGLAFDAEGGLWVTEVTRNAIYRIDRDENATCLFADPGGGCLDFPASIAFGGSDRRTLYVGSIRMDHVPRLSSPWAGGKLWHDD